jgi:hypothetical protein
MASINDLIKDPQVRRQVEGLFTRRYNKVGIATSLTGIALMSGHDYGDLDKYFGLYTIAREAPARTIFIFANANDLRNGELNLQSRVGTEALPGGAVMVAIICWNTIAQVFPPSLESKAIRDRLMIELARVGAFDADVDELLEKGIIDIKDCIRKPINR